MAKRQSKRKKASRAKKSRPRKKDSQPATFDWTQNAHAMASAGAIEAAFDVADVERVVTTQKRVAERERTRRVEEYEKAIKEFSKTTTAELFGKGKRKKTKPAIRPLAEGDSWFDFPFGGKRPFSKGDVIAQLSTMIPYPILNIAVRGDEIRQMLGVKQRARLEALLKNKKHDFNALLFSGGGNDLVGDQLCLWLRSSESIGGDPIYAVDEPAIAHGLGIIRSGYEQLFDMRDSITKDAKRRIAVFIHAYDFAIPTGKGVCGYGPWLKPSLDYRGWTDRKEGKLIIKNVLGRLAAMLRDLASRREDVYFVETQGVVGAREWNDELHPNGAGFRKVAVKFTESLRQAFPDELP